ncbi:hypothetical protein Tco_0421103, partial [Tanacetum coccineum]
FIIVLVVMFQFLGLIIGDCFASLLAFFPTGWAILQIAQSCRPVVKGLRMWGSVKALGREYEYLMGVMIFTPVAILAWFPMIDAYGFPQTPLYSLRLEMLVAVYVLVTWVSLKLKFCGTV